MSVNESAWYAAVITWVTRGRYSHVRLVTGADGECVEAVSGGVRWGRVQEGDVVIATPITDVQASEVRDLAAALIDTPYGWIDVALLGLAQLGVRIPSLRRTLRVGAFRTRLLGESRLRNPRRLFCSQLVDHVWRLTGFQAFDDGRTSQNVSPADLADVALRWNSVLESTDRKTSTGVKK